MGLLHVFALQVDLPAVVLGILGRSGTWFVALTVGFWVS